MSLIEVLPLAVVMVAGPQIISTVVLATSHSWRKNSAAFLLGSLLSITLVVSTSYVIGFNLISSTQETSSTLLLLILLLLLYAMLQTYLKRNVSEPPKWMGKLQTLKTGSSFKLGFLLLGFFPTNLATNLAVGSYLSAQGDPLINSAGFIFLTLLFLGTPATALILYGEKAEKKLPEVRKWMNQNSWIINELVLTVFILITLNNIT